MGALPWLDEAWREFGEHERSGAAGNPRILAFYRDAGQSGIANDETAWCAAFVGACLARSGLHGTGSLMARSYLEWGEAATSDQRLRRRRSLEPRRRSVARPCRFPTRRDAAVNHPAGR